jgi:hypothetical protein
MANEADLVRKRLYSSRIKSPLGIFGYKEVGEQSGAGSVGRATSRFLSSEGGVSEQLCWREA